MFDFLKNFKKIFSNVKDFILTYIKNVKLLINTNYFRVID